MLAIEPIRQRLADATRDTGPTWAYESCGEKGDGSNIVGTMFHPDDQDATTPLLGRCDAIYDEEKHEYREYYRDELVAEIEHRNRNPGGLAEFISHAPTDMAALVAEVETLRQHVRNLLHQVSTEPVKHPQQSTERATARASLSPETT